MSAPKGVAEVIAGLLAGLALRLRAWDGSEAGPADAPVLVARSPRALQRILWRPGELGLARAYVSGDLDVEGDLTDALRRVRAPRPRRARTALAAVQAAARLKLLAPPPEPPRCELRVRGRPHSRARDQAVIAGHYDLPTAFYRLILDPSLAYSCAYWDGPARDLAQAQRAKLDAVIRPLDQTLLRPEGLPGRPWYMHMIYAPGRFTGYGAKTMPGIREGIEDERFDDASKYIGLTADALKAYATKLDQATAFLNGSPAVN